VHCEDSGHREVEEALCQIYKGEIATADVLKRTGP